MGPYPTTLHTGESRYPGAVRVVGMGGEAVRPEGTRSSPCTPIQGRKPRAQTDAGASPPPSASAPPTNPPRVIPAQAGIQRGRGAGRPHYRPQPQSPSTSVLHTGESRYPVAGNPHHQPPPSLHTTPNLRSRESGNPGQRRSGVASPHPDTTPSRETRTPRYPLPMQALTATATQTTTIGARVSTTASPSSTVTVVAHPDGSGEGTAGPKKVKYLTYSWNATDSLQNKGETTSAAATGKMRTNPNEWRALRAQHLTCGRPLFPPSFPRSLPRTPIRGREPRAGADARGILTSVRLRSPYQPPTRHSCAGRNPEGQGGGASPPPTTSVPPHHPTPSFPRKREPRARAEGRGVPPPP